MTSPIGKYILDASNPTLNYQVENILALPLHQLLFEPHYAEPLKINTNELIKIARNDWDSKEISWDFKKPNIITNNMTEIKKAWEHCKFTGKEVTLRTQTLEQANLDILAEIYGLKTKLIPKEHITLFNNSVFMYKNCSKITCSREFEELISYTIGCIMGRYSLDQEGLVYAHSGNNGFKELVAEGAYKTFPADDDGIVPLADEEWLFDDDATPRFREFMKTVWGDSLLENGRSALQENLDFVAESLCLDAIKPKKGESSMDTIRRYFSTQFYKDHLKTYKKRPIYWLFSSGKEKAFECLVYLHRYNESTLSRMRTEYVTPLMGKLESRKNILEDSKATATGAEQRAIDKELKTIDKKQAELVKFDEELKHLAEMKISIDLDDGVKVNYGKFGNLLADVKGIHGKAPEKIK